MAKTERKAEKGHASSATVAGRTAVADAETPDEFKAQVAFDFTLGTNAVVPPIKVGKRKRLSKKENQNGHRERLRTRLAEGGADAMPDYELIELVLCRAIPRADVKPIAKDLVRTFGTFAEVVNATPLRLREVHGVGPRVIEELLLIRAAGMRMLRTRLEKRESLSSWQAVLDYVTAAQAYDNKEVFRVLFLDKRNNIIADEVQSRGTVDHTPVYVREVIGRALELAATAMILVHNHPSGDPSPSRADIDMTKQIMSAGQPLGVTVHDHIIVGRQGHVSMRVARLI